MFTFLCFQKLPGPPLCCFSVRPNHRFLADLGIIEKPISRLCGRPVFTSKWNRAASALTELVHKLRKPLIKALIVEPPF